MDEKWHLIYAYEHRYGGYFGVNDWRLLWGSLATARDEAEQLSRQVIAKNGVDVFFHKVEDYEDGVEQDIAYEVWEIQEDAPTNAILSSDAEPLELIQKYGTKLVGRR